MEPLTVEDVADFREPVRRLCADRFDRSAVRETGAAPELDRDVWRALCEIGVIGVLAPEAHGGLDLGVGVAAALWEECGRGLAPGPLTTSALAACLLPDVASGDLLVTGGLPLGTDLLVEHPEAADALLILGDEVRLVGLRSLPQRRLAALDPCTPVALVGTSDPGDVVGDAADADRLRAIGAVLSASYLVGIARLAIELAAQHARDRDQFGRPIGGFQAVKHLLADMAVATELAAVAVAAAAAAIDAPRPGAARAVAAAKVLAGDAARIATKHCIQVHGGMGYTWEADPQLLFKRALVWEQAFGSADAHAAAIGAGLGTPR